MGTGGTTGGIRKKTIERRRRNKEMVGSRKKLFKEESPEKEKED
jgi:hypothetical protein